MHSTQRSFQGLGKVKSDSANLTVEAWNDYVDAVGSLSSAMEAHLAAVQRTDATVGAFSYLNYSASRQAQSLQLNDVPGGALKLFGVPVTVKDVIDTRDMPTEFGSPLAAGRRPENNAAVVSRLRAEGAIILGKSVTTEFAIGIAGKTRNPCDFQRTPGASSSGSAACVAAGMTPVAIGTQTNGSVIRPASYCGIVGFKPTWGMVPLDGTLCISSTLDHIGIFARCVKDVSAVFSAIADKAPDDNPSKLMTEADGKAGRNLRVGFIKGPFWDRASEEARSLIEAYLQQTVPGSAIVDLPTGFDQCAKVHEIIMKKEASQNIGLRVEHRPAGVSDKLRRFLDEGNYLSEAAYRRALDLRLDLMEKAQSIFSDIDVGVTLSACDEAPIGYENTGDPILATTWSLLGAPAISMPLLTLRSGMPLGVQIVATPGHDSRVLDFAAFLQEKATRVRHVIGSRYP